MGTNEFEKVRWTMMSSHVDMWDLMVWLWVKTQLSTANFTHISCDLATVFATNFVPNYRETEGTKHGFFTIFAMYVHM